MEFVVRNVVEPFFETIFRRFTELENKISSIDAKITRIEHEVLVLRCKIDTRQSIPDYSNYMMEEVD